MYYLIKNPKTLRDKINLNLLSKNLTIIKSAVTPQFVKIRFFKSFSIGLCIPFLFFKIRIEAR